MLAMDGGVAGQIVQGAAEGEGTQLGVQVVGRLHRHLGAGPTGVLGGASQHFGH
ncbi:hypothetical protein D3C86_2138530 [compost metagenome]